MKLSFAIILLVAAVAQINAAAVISTAATHSSSTTKAHHTKSTTTVVTAVPNSSAKTHHNKTTTTVTTTTTVPTSGSGSCVSGSFGLRNGDGYKGYCCKNQADCKDDCVKGVCVGPTALNTNTDTNTKTHHNKTTTTVPTTTPAAGKCVAGSFGLRNGDGYKGYCCKSEADCKDDCVKGVCVGPTAPNANTNTKTDHNKTTTTVSTTTVPTTTPVAGKCVAGSFGLRNGDGYKGYCCKSEADCKDDCVKGVCVGPTAPNSNTNTNSNTNSNTKTHQNKTTTTAPTTTVPTTTPAAGSCVSGSFGLGRGDGYKGYCCKKEADCKDDCIKGVCVGPTAPNTTPHITSHADPHTTSNVCTPGSSGLGNGDGKTNACCKSSDDCEDSCVDGRCGVTP